MTLAHVFSLLSVVLSVRADPSYWINPPASGPAGSLAGNIDFTLGSVATLKWYSNLSTYDLTLWQQQAGNNGADYAGLPFSAKGNGFGPMEFNWTVDTMATNLNVSNVYYIFLGLGKPEAIGCHYFNIVRPSNSNSVSSSSSTTRTLSTLSVATSSATTTSTSTTSTSTAIGAAGSSSEGNPPGSTSATTIGLGVGLGVGLLLVLIVVIFLGMKLKKRKNERASYHESGMSSDKQLKEAQGALLLHSPPTSYHGHPALVSERPELAATPHKPVYEVSDRPTSPVEAPVDGRGHPK